MEFRSSGKRLRVSRGGLAWLLVGLAGAALIAVSLPRIIDSSLFGGGASATSAELQLPGSLAGQQLCRPGLSYSQCHPTAARFTPDDTTLHDCTQSFSCFEQAFGNLAYRHGPRVALGMLGRMMSTNAVVAADCHRMAHVVGAATLARFHDDVSRAFAAGSSTCASGYYHGILERALRDAPKLGIVAAARRLCAGSEVRRTVWLAYQCVHGLGHGLMLYSGYNLPFALKVCDQLATPLDRSWCPGGVFMENIVTSYGGQSPWLRRSNPVYPCNVVQELDKQACYGMVTSWMNIVDGWDWSTTVRTCHRSEPKYVSTCFYSLGRDASGHSLEDPQAVLSICKLDRQYWSYCVLGAAADFSYHFLNGKRAARLCGLIDARGVEAACFAQIGQMLGTMNQSAAWRLGSCRSITAVFVAACVRGMDSTPTLAAIRPPPR